MVPMAVPVVIRILYHCLLCQGAVVVGVLAVYRATQVALEVAFQVPVAEVVVKAAMELRR
jgi:hypothetical protein